VSSIAAVLIVKNEAENLNACLETLAWADEIVILDSGSTDATEAIARAHGARFFRDDDWQGFGRQRQRAETLVNSEWILMVDADERVTDTLRESIGQCVSQGAAIGSIARLSWCFGSFIHHGGWYPDRVLRLYPKGLAGYDDARVHEKLSNDHGLTVRHLEGDLLHFTYRDLRHYLEKSAHYAQAWAQSRQERGQRGSLGLGILHAIGCFLRMYVLKRGVLDGRQGLLLALLSSHSTFVKYADLWIRTRTSAR